MKKLVMGILAHVDAGKTTLSEALLYRSGAISQLGRVDRGDSVLDSGELERKRGITIFSKQISVELGNTHLTLIDTPGHVDFSCETERALSVQEYAILLISATDGVRAHTLTLWQLLSARRIPTLIFVNKTDICHRTQDEILRELQGALSPSCVSFSREDGGELFESCASHDTRLMEEFFNTDTLSARSVGESIRRRRLFPVVFGSALKLKGVDRLMEVIDTYALPTGYSESLFGARVYKIDRDPSGRRMTLLRVTGGALRPKDLLTLTDKEGRRITEKVEELRTLHGGKSQPIKEALPGDLCAVIGPRHTRAGMGLGTESDDRATLSPVLDYTLLLPKDVNPYEAYLHLCELGEEDPSLGIRYLPESREIRVSLMGEIQAEVLKATVRSRFGLDARLRVGSILYRETVAAPVIGRGHFEPLGHYAEVHLLIEPEEEGTGITKSSLVDRDSLSLNWQRLIMTHLGERVHRGVLTGSPLTDVKLTLIGGRAHQKHTEGGDFREATYRAIRQGLMKAESVLLEPTFDFTASVPQGNLGRLLQDLENMKASYSTDSMEDGIATVKGYCPVSAMRGYPTALRAYTSGCGSISLTPGRYIPCHNPEEAMESIGYDPLTDDGHTPSSVFCKGGAGYAVDWQQADTLMHIKDTDRYLPSLTEQGDGEGEEIPLRARRQIYRGTAEEDKELMRIFESTYGKISRRSYSEKKVNEAPKNYTARTIKPKKPRDSFLLIDCYNLIFSSEELKKISETDFALGRDELIRRLCSFSAFHGQKVIAVFDAYRVKKSPGAVEKAGEVTVIYTKEAETADAYIEKATYELASDNLVRVVTSDLTEQYIILGNGALRISAREFLRDLAETDAAIHSTVRDYALNPANHRH